MLALHLVVLAVLAAPSSQSGIPRYFRGQWLLSDEKPQNEDVGEHEAAAEGLVQPEGPTEGEHISFEDQTLLTTPTAQTALKEQEPPEEKEAEEPGVWTVVVVTVFVLVSVVGSLSLAYYLCVWRGGRIHYQPQKDGYA